MNIKYYKYIASIIATFVPVIAFAAIRGNLNDLVKVIIYYLNSGLVLMMAFAVVMFTFYVVKYYVMPNEDRTEGNTYVMYSIIGFFVILSFWGLVNILQNSFGLGNQTPGNWASFTNIFPGGGSSSSGNSVNNASNMSDQIQSNPFSNDPNQQAN